MYTLTDKQFQEDAEPIFRKIFVNDDPFEAPFSSEIVSKMMLFPIWTDLESSFLQSLSKAAFREGDLGCYLSRLIEYDDCYNHCYIPLSELLKFYISPSDNEKSIREQKQIILYPEYAIFSEQGKWGLLVAEHCGVLGGSHQFIEAMRANLPNLDQQIYSWLSWLKLEKIRCNELYVGGQMPKYSWAEKLLVHLYGQESAKEMIIKTGILE